MSDKVVPLFAVNTLANNNAELASCLRGMADEIERGQQGDVTNVLVVLSADSLELLALGKPMSVTQMIGLLAITQAKAISSCTDLP